jgi:hypothetical protein
MRGWWRQRCWWVWCDNCGGSGPTNRGTTLTFLSQRVLPPMTATQSKVRASHYWSHFISTIPHRFIRHLGPITRFPICSSHRHVLPDLTRYQALGARTTHAGWQRLGAMVLFVCGGDTRERGGAAMSLDMPGSCAASAIALLVFPPLPACVDFSQRVSTSGQS